MHFSLPLACEYFHEFAVDQNLLSSKIMPIDFLFILLFLLPVNSFYYVFLLMSDHQIVCCRPSVIPGPVPDELVVSAAESIGVFWLYCGNYSISTYPFITLCACVFVICL